jgi:hypothetical protein
MRAQRVEVADRAHVAAGERDVAVDLHARHELVHAVERAQERGLAGVGRADDAEDLVLLMSRSTPCSATLP